MMPPLLLLFYLIMTDKKDLDSFFNPDILKKLTINKGALSRKVRIFLQFIAIFLMIVALSRPVLEKGEVQVKKKNIDIVAAIDISKSMLAKDIFPNRFEFVKNRLFKLMDNFQEANLGVLAFSTNSFLVSPMTNDFNTIKYLVNNLSLDYIDLSGTDFFPVIKSAKEFLKNSKDKILIIFTDGGDKEDFSKEIEEANKSGLVIYIYGIATTKGSPIEDDGELIKDNEGNIVISSLNEKISSLALETGGAFVKGALRSEALNFIIQDIKERFDATLKKQKKIKIYVELFYYPLALALVFLLMSFSSLPKRKASAIVALLLLHFLVPANASVLDFWDIKKAEKFYKNKDFKTSSKIYEKLAKTKKSAEAYYNLANSYYKEKNYKKALEAYKKMPNTNKELEFKKLYNMGNSFATLKEYDKAEESYKKALDIKEDDDARYNLEQIKKLKKRQKKKNANKNNKKRDNKQKNSKKDEKKEKNQSLKSDKNAGKKAEQRQMSKMEERKWTKLLQNRKPKTLPLQLQTKKRGSGIEEKPW